MNARSWNRCGMVIAMMALLYSTAAADDGRPSRDTLADMGLSGLVVVSDDEALAIRGQGLQRRFIGESMGQFVRDDEHEEGHRAFRERLREQR